MQQETNRNESSPIERASGGERGGYPSDRLNEDAVRSYLREKAKCRWLPASVYRLQFSAAFTFRAAADAVPYLKELGVNTVYCSPYFETPPGSLHGYNVVDPNRINPEIGTQEDFDRFCGALKEAGLAQIVDVVPNHMGIQGLNRLWRDTLENGPSSIYASFFDVNWEPEKRELRHRVLIPVLGNPYGQVLENGELRLDFTGREFVIRYWDHELPISPTTYPRIMECGQEELRGLLGENHENYLEFLSIITAFRNLPEKEITDPSKVYERNREKEIAKSRLETLVSKSPEIRAHLEKCVLALNGEKGRPESFDRLHELLNEQAYRLAYWRVASEEINYRRFFDINELAAIRIEEDEVFEFHHRLIFDLIGRGVLQGLRIDHPDGLYDPPGYFRHLQGRYLFETALRDAAASGADLSEEEKALVKKILSEEEFRKAKPLYVVVEKILDREEMLPEQWKVHGTVGYEFLNALNGVFVDRSHEKEFGALYEKFMGHTINFEQLIYDKKKFFALIHMASEMNNLGHRLKGISEKNRHFRDFTRNNLIVAIREVIACFPVYRTYISPGGLRVSERDERYIRTAVSKARKKTPALPSAVYDFLQDVLLLKLEKGMKPEDKDECREFVLKFQQLTGPVMAKGLEDTAFYIYNRLLSLNEVGGDPLHFGLEPGQFHELNLKRSRLWPANFLCASTHDTKRSEDVRMRLNVLSEMPERWEGAIDRWGRMNEKYRTMLDSELVPKRNTEYFIYQTMLGAWPDEEMDAAGRENFRQRILGCLEKSVREAKLYTNWINPNPEYENAVKSFAEGILKQDGENSFLQDFRAFQKEISFYGKLNSLSALVLRMASPGVVDIYQGGEMWDYSLVDPDNRRPVDFARRAGALKSVRDAAQRADGLRGLAARLDDGLLKLFFTWKGLECRKAHQDVFVGGDYAGLEVSGARSDCLIAFLRERNGKKFIAAAGRFFTRIYPEAKRTGPAAWEDTAVLLPAGGEGEWRDIFTGSTFRPDCREGKLLLEVRHLFRDADAVLLEFIEGSQKTE